MASVVGFLQRREKLARDEIQTGFARSVDWKIMSKELKIEFCKIYSRDMLFIINKILSLHVLKTNKSLFQICISPHVLSNTTSF